MEGSAFALMQVLSGKKSDDNILDFF